MSLYLPIFYFLAFEGYNFNKNLKQERLKVEEQYYQSN